MFPTVNKVHVNTQPRLVVHSGNFINRDRNEPCFLNNHPCVCEHNFLHAFNCDPNIGITPMVLRVVWHFDKGKKFLHTFIIRKWASLL